MACSQGMRTASCTCCKEAEDFQKIVELKSIGLTIYRYTLPEKDFQMDTNQIGQFDSVSRITEDIFIVHNTKSVDVTPSQCMSELRNNEIKCPRCKKIVEHAQKLLQYVPTIEKDEVRGFCDLCMLKQKTCDDCENIIKKFISNQKKLSANTKNRIKQWLSKMNQILEVEQPVDSIKIRRAKSDLSIDRLKSPERDRILNVKDLYKPGSLHKTELHENLAAIGQSNPILELEERAISEQPSTARLYYTHLKEKRLKTFQHIPPARQHSVEESFFKSNIRYPNVEPIDIDKGFDRLQRHGTSKTLIKEKGPTKYEDEIVTDADNVKTELSKLRRFFSEESLRTVTAASSKNELLKRNFTFYFPKKMKPKRPKKYQSSSELIITTREQLEERKDQRREIQRLAKLEAQNKKRREREEKQAMEEKRELMGGYQSVDEREKEENEGDRESDYVKRTGTREIEDIARTGKGEVRPYTAKEIEERDGKVKRGERKDEGEKDKRVSKREGGDRQGKSQRGEREDKDEKREKERKGKKGEKDGKEETQEQGKLERREKGGKQEKEEKAVKEEKREKAEKGLKGKEERDEKLKGGKKVIGDGIEKVTKRGKDENNGKRERGQIEGKKDKGEKENKKEREDRGKGDRVGKEDRGGKEDREERKGRAEKGGAREKIIDRGEKSDKDKKDESGGRETRAEKTKTDKKGVQEKGAEKRDKEKSKEKNEIDVHSGKGREDKLEKDGTLQKGDKIQKSPKSEAEIGQEKFKKSQHEREKENSGVLQVKSDTEKKGEQSKEQTERKEKEVDEKQQFKVDKEDQKARDLIQKTKSDRVDAASVKNEIFEKDEKKTKKGKKDQLQVQDKQIEKGKKGKSPGKEVDENERDKKQKHKEELNNQKSRSIGKSNARLEKSKNVINDDELNLLQKFKFKDDILMSTKDHLRLEQVKLRPEEIDVYLQLVKIKPIKYKGNKPKGLIPRLSQMLHRHHSHYGKKKCPFCESSELEFVATDLLREDHEQTDIIVGKKIYKFRSQLAEVPPEPERVPLFFKSRFFVKEPMMLKSVQYKENEIKSVPEPLKELTTKRSAKAQVKTVGDQTSSTKGIIRYALSDRSFIDKGWTMLPTEKVVKKMNVYRMRPVQPEFDWFKNHKKKGLMTYDTGEKLAEFNDDGSTRWFYKNGRVALDYYDAEEANAQQRIVIYSGGETDSRGRSLPFTILATFDYLGNGIVLDHSGKVRMKYNQSEGVVVDRSLGPLTHWKWHTLNDPPVLQQVMIDTQASHKDPAVMKLSTGLDKPQRAADEQMLAIEFDNFIKEKSKKLNQSYRPFKIKMKAIKINEQFSLKVLDQARVYLIFRDGMTHIRLNIGMNLDHKEIVDTDTSELGDVSTNLERLPARSESLCWLQKKMRDTQRFDRVRNERERRLQHPGPVAKSSADILTAATSKPLQTPIRTFPSSSSVATNCYCSRKPTKDNVYYDTNVF